MRRRAPVVDQGKVRPPAELLDPHVEDFVDVGREEAAPAWMGRAAWLEQLAGQRHLAAVVDFSSEHRGRLDMSVDERRAWLLGGPVPTWRGRRP